MDRIEFISWLLRFFNVSDFIFQSEMPKYNNGLLNNLDYVGLKGFIEQTCKTRPNSVEINKMATMYKFFSGNVNKDPALRHIERIKLEPHIEMKSFDEYLKDKIRKFCSKNGITPCFDRKAEIGN